MAPVTALGRADFAEKKLWSAFQERPAVRASRSRLRQKQSKTSLFADSVASWRPRQCRKKKAPKPSGFGALVRTMRFELTRSPTRPSNVRVCQFRHVRVTGLTGFAIIRKDFYACQVVKKCGWADRIKLFILGDWLAFLSCCRCSCCGWTYCSFCCDWSCVPFYCLHQSRYGCPCCLHSGCYHSYC